MPDTNVTDLHVGSPRSRVDGRAKVTGAATYSAEFGSEDLLYGYVVSSGIARGRIVAIDAAAAEAVPGVVKVLTHANRPRTAWFNYNYEDMVAPPGKPFRALYSDEIQYSGQPVALVVAATFQAARDAAGLLKISYHEDPHVTDLEQEIASAYVPPKKRSGIAPPPSPRGDAEKAIAAAEVRLSQRYSIAPEHHNPMEPHATTVIWGKDGHITVHDKIQGVQNSLAYVLAVFGLSKSKVDAVTPYVGGGFGCGLRPQYQLYLAMMAATELERSVRVVLTRDQMFTHVFRPQTIQTVTIGADGSGTIRGIKHDAIACTSQFEDHQEVVVNWTGLMYGCENFATSYKLVKLDTYTPGDMRAPGAPLGMFAVESAMDELAYALKTDPVELRLLNYTDTDLNEDKPYTSKELRAAFVQGAEKFGWAKRSAEPRSMREGRELIGWGMAAGAWESQMQKTSASARFTSDGRLEVCSSTADIGTGTYTILTQLAADALGLPMDKVTVKLGDSRFPEAPVEGGSWTAASAGTAVQMACYAVREKLFKFARGAAASPLANMDLDRAEFTGGRITVAGDPSRSMSLVQALQSGGVDAVEEEQTASPDPTVTKRYSSYTHGAAFVEVRVDEELGVVRVTRVVQAIAAGKILNPKTARSQIIGGTVFGIGMALEEETMTDHTLGRFMNHNLAEYHVPVNADVQGIEVIFVEEHDDKASPIGVKGLGEIGLVGVPAAIANAVFHATGKRVRDLPITIDKILG